MSCITPFVRLHSECELALLPSSEARHDLTGGKFLTWARKRPAWQHFPNAALSSCLASYVFRELQMQWLFRISLQSAPRCKR